MRASVIRGAPSVIRGSECPEVVSALTALRDLIHHTWLEEFLRLAACVKSEIDRAQMHATLDFVRQNVGFFEGPMPTEKKRVALTPEDRRDARRMKLRAKRKMRLQ